MKKFLYQINKEEKDTFIELNKYLVDKKEKTYLEKEKTLYSLFVKKKDFKDLKIESENVEISNYKFKDMNNEKVLEIKFKSKELYEFIKEELKEVKGTTYEQDIHPEHKYLIDNEIKLVEEDEYIPLKYLSIDIETIGDKDAQKIVLISSFSHNHKHMNKVYCDMSKITEDKLDEVNKHNFKDFEFVKCEDETSLLEKFRNEVIEFEPQVMIGWNVIDFDFNVIRNRMKALNIEFKFSKFEGKNSLKIRSDFFADSSMECPGVLVFDTIHLLKKNFIIFESYKLDNVAKEVLGDEKIDIEDESAPESIENKIVAIENMLKRNPIKLIEYNFKDSKLTSMIVEKLNLLELMCKRSILTGTPLSKVRSPIATLDLMYLKKLHKKNLVAPSNFNFQKSGPIEGAFVVDPKKGFYTDIFVLDFKSLYPSVIMTFNIDPFTFNKNGQIEAPNGAKFNKEKGILPELILKLYKERDKAKIENDKTKSMALKTTMNSFYGAIASPKSRFHNSEIGEAITGFARYIIKKAMKRVEELGYEVVYGDTDSIFVKFNSEFKNLNSKKKKGEELEKELNNFIRDWVKSEFNQKNFLQIELEKIYSKFFIATKKRYVGYDELSRKTKFVGMEAIRGDWTDIARNFQIKLIEDIFSQKDKEYIKEVIKDYVKKLRNREMDDELIYTKKITKPLSQYTKITPPHVKAAREVEGFSGRVVKYMMLKSGPKHISLVKENDEIDYEHYVDKQLKGVSDDILEVFGVDFDETIKSIKQKSLDAFF